MSINASHWVIGGSSGIGAYTADMLLSKGHCVVKTGKDEFDVTNDEVLKKWEEFGRPSNIVYSAGINYLNWMGKGCLDEHLRVLDVNLFGFIRVVDALVSVGVDWPANIVAVSSDAGVRPLRTSISYCASKAGLDMAVRCAARELGPHGWRVNAVAPGMVDHTEMTKYVDETVPALRNWSVSTTLAYEQSQEVVEGRVQKSEVADAICWLLEAGPHVNGVILPVNGGR